MSSSVLQGKVSPPPLLHSLGFRQLRSGLLLLQTIFLQMQTTGRRPADDLQMPSLRRPKWVLLVQSRPKWVLLVQSRPKWVLLVLQTTCRRQAYVDPSGSCSSRVDPSGSCSSCRRPADAKPTSTQVGPAHPESTQVGPARPEIDPAVPGPSRRRSFDLPQRSSDHSSSQGSDTPPLKRRRLSGNSSEDEDPSSQNRQQRDDQQDEEDNFRLSSLDLLLNYITKKFPAASQPLVQPSSKRFHVMESAGLVDESSQQSSNLAWFGHMRSACDSAQRKFESKVSEGKSLSSMLTSVSRTERVSDSPCQGRAVKVNSQVFDLMSSRPAESRSVPLSVREAATLETALRGVMESYNFQLWTVTDPFRFLGDSGFCPMDDPLLDQFQRSFSRGGRECRRGIGVDHCLCDCKKKGILLIAYVSFSHRRPDLSDPLF